MCVEMTDVAHLSNDATRLKKSRQIRGVSVRARTTYGVAQLASPRLRKSSPNVALAAHNPKGRLAERFGQITDRRLYGFDFFMSHRLCGTLHGENPQSQSLGF